MTRSLVQNIKTCLNIFPSKNGLSRDLSSAAIILGSPTPDYNTLKIMFGEYAQVYIGTTNSTEQRTVGVIALISEIERGRYYFISLSTRKNLHDSIWTELTINDQVISRLNDLATKDK